MLRQIINYSFLTFFLIFFSCNHKNKEKNASSFKLKSTINVLQANVYNDTLELITDNPFIWKPLNIKNLSMNFKQNIRDTVFINNSEFILNKKNNDTVILKAIILSSEIPLSNGLRIGTSQNELLSKLNFPDNETKTLIERNKPYKVISFFDPPGEMYDIHLIFGNKNKKIKRIEIFKIVN